MDTSTAGGTAATQSTAAAGGFLGGGTASAATTTGSTATQSTTAASNTAAATTTTATTAANTAESSFFLDARLHKDGQLNEGWADSLRQAGFERLANKGALAKDEKTFLKSLDDTLGMVGKKPVTYPTVTSTEAEVAEYRKAAGVPDQPAGYELKPAKLPEGVEWDEAGAGEFAAVLHKHHASGLLAKDLGEMWANQQVKFREAAQGGFEQQIETLANESAAVFGKEWGAEADARREANIDFVKARGLDLTNPVLRMALSHPDVVRFVDEARRALREAPLPGVEAGIFAGSASPREQARELMKANPRWSSNPELSKRISDLHALQAQHDKRVRK